jgi:hypothetical protein
VTLGGRRAAVERPRVRTADGQAELRLRTYDYFADRDPLARSVLDRMLAGVSRRVATGARRSRSGRRWSSRRGRRRARRSRGPSSSERGRRCRR